MKILHVASFHGNIGDNANHAGFRPWFEMLAGTSIVWSEVEIRDIYRKTHAFDATFAKKANAADLVVIGGGNYFELWVSNSPTGTSISISDDVMNAIRTPIFFNALGVDLAQGFTGETLSRFRKFLSRLLDSDQYLVSVRNDGAMMALKTHMFELPLHKVLSLPDGGFFASYKAMGNGVGPCIGINLAGDMLEERFPGGAFHTYQTFLTEMAETLTRIWHSQLDVRFVFFPHIFRDLSIYADLLALLPDQLRRSQVRVAAYDSGADAASEVFGGYLNCDAVLAMRFHSNVVPIGHGVAVIGLGCYDQIKHLYDELKDPDSVVDVRRPGFGTSLLQLVHDALNRPEQARARAQKMKGLVVAQRAVAGEKISAWLARHRGSAGTGP